MSENSPIGLIPAGGRGVRLGRQPTSKEILPVILPPSHSGRGTPGVVSDCLLESFAQAGIRSTYFILAPGKWDIPEHFGAVTGQGISLGYLVRQHPFGVPFTIDAAYRFVGERRVAFGFPDILFRPADAVAQLVAHQDESDADVVLGVFPVEAPEKWDSVEIGRASRVARVHPKPHHEATDLTWILAVWNPAFTRFLHEFVGRYDLQMLEREPNRDISLGIAIQAALQSHLAVESVIFENGRCLDVGTPDDLEKARQENWWS